MMQLDTNEQVLYVAQKHWLVIAMRIFGLLLLAVAPVLAYQALVYYLGVPIAAVWEHALSFIYTIFLAFVWLIIFVTWTDYYLDVWLVTDRRIIDIEQKGLFSRNVAHVQHENVQDVTVEVAGFLNTVFQYGTMHVQTAASEKEFVMPYIAHPHTVQKRIMDLVHKKQDEVQTVRIAEK